MASLPLDKQMNVIKANIGAETENISKCFRALLRSRPSCSRKVTRPNAAGALWSIIARKMIISTSNSLVAAAAPNAIPSAAAWTTNPSVVVQLTGPLPPLFLLWPEITMSGLEKLLSNYVINTIWTLITKWVLLFLQNSQFKLKMGSKLVITLGTKMFAKSGLFKM